MEFHTSGHDVIPRLFALCLVLDFFEDFIPRGGLLLIGLQREVGDPHARGFLFPFHGQTHPHDTPCEDTVTVFVACIR